MIYIGGGKIDGRIYRIPWDSRIVSFLGGKYVRRFRCTKYSRPTAGVRTRPTRRRMAPLQRFAASVAAVALAVAFHQSVSGRVPQLVRARRRGDNGVPAVRDGGRVGVSVIRKAQPEYVEVQEQSAWATEGGRWVATSEFTPDCRLDE
jgi:hypothetical protein